MNKPYSFNVDDKKDPDIVAWLDKIPKGQISAFIRDAIRCQMAQERDLSNKELADLLLSAISNLSLAASVTDQVENPEIIRALAGLGEF